MHFFKLIIDYENQLIFVRFTNILDTIEKPDFLNVFFYKIMKLIYI